MKLFTLNLSQIMKLVEDIHYSKSPKNKKIQHYEKKLGVPFTDLLRAIDLISQQPSTEQDVGDEDKIVSFLCIIHSLSSEDKNLTLLGFLNKNLREGEKPYTIDSIKVTEKSQSPLPIKKRFWEESEHKNHHKKLKENNTATEYANTTNQLITHLFNAVHEGNLSKVHDILSSPVDLKLKDIYLVDIKGNSLLMIAIQNKHTDIAAELISAGISLDHKNNDNQTALTLAIETNNVQIVQLLLEHGVDIHQTGANDQLPMTLAAAAENVKIMQLLSAKATRAFPDIAGYTTYDCLDFSETNKLGSGTYGCVYDALTIENIRVAVKFIKCKKQNKEKFQQEAQLMSTLDNSPNVVQLFDYNLSQQFFVMEYVPVSLKHMLYEQNQTTVPCLDTAYQIACGVRYIHENQIIHCDLKSANILWKNGTIKIADFGLAQYETSSFKINGSRVWMAPELLARRSTNNRKTDMYSLGMVYYEIQMKIKPNHYYQSIGINTQTLSKEINAGTRPSFNEENNKNNEKITPFITLIKTCWATDPKARPTANHAAKQLAVMMKV